MKTHDDATAAAELARASRLERMANDLMIEAREIRSHYAKPRQKKAVVNMRELIKTIKCRA